MISRGVLISAGVSATLHMALLGWIPEWHTRPKQTLVPALAVRTITEATAPPIPPLIPSQHERRLPTEPPIKHVSEEPEALPVQTPGPVGISTSPDSWLASRVQYLASADVDIPLAPLSDWVLRGEELSPGQTVTIQLTIYVNAQGQLDGYELLGSSVGDTQTYSVLRDLVLTRFSAAFKNGGPVASQRDVEITIDNSIRPYGIQRPFLIRQ